MEDSSENLDADRSPKTAHPEPHPTARDVLRELGVPTEDNPNKNRTDGGGENKRAGLPEKELPTEEITTKKITWERARMLATTRRKRISEFALGGFVAALPGAVQSVVDYLGKPRVVPTGGHLVEIGIAIIFGTLSAASLFQFSDPTSADVLARTFPEMVEQERFVRRIRRWWKRLREDFSIPV
ncbi:MAG TPA: hypothetical protein VMU22_02725 [Rhizomicrobium sp.]|nr:hypothetical protein [Rhizomicrobium sp.]